jgi:hypothetical protein
MMPVDDIHLQLVDLPSISPEHPIPWIGNALQPADCCMLVADLAHPGTIDRIAALHEILAERRVHLVDTWPNEGPATDSIADLDPFAVYLPTVLVVNKIDIEGDYLEDVEVFEELTGYTYPYLGVSALTGAGLDDLGRWLTDRLGVVRVYTKLPGQAPDLTRPFTVRLGATVHDVARLVHKDVARGLKYARVWGTASFDGQQVGPEHEVTDKDILELHS